MTNFARHALFAASLALVPALGACGNADSAEGPAAPTKDSGSATMASAIGSAADLGTLKEALSKSELATVFDGPASYTLLAPSDAAFAALGDKGKALLEDQQRPVLVGLLRNHVVPGHITPEGIKEAIKTKGGPVTMTTLGDGKLTFSMKGDNLAVQLDDGTTADLTGTPVATSNGALIPLDKVLLPEAEKSSAG